MNELEILHNVCRMLGESEIQYMLTGSMAMNYYSTPRMTRDLDIIIELKIADIELLFSRLKDEYYADIDRAKAAVESGKMFNIIHNYTSVKVDFIIRKNNEYRVQEFQRRKKVTFGKSELYIVSKEDLMISKLLWAKDSRSEMQQRDIQNLAKSGYDEKYVRENSEKLGVYSLFQEFMNE